MAVVSSTIQIQVPVGDEVVTFVCRRPTAQEQSRFLKDRFEAKGRKVKSHLYEARVALIDTVLIDLKNAEFETAAGERKALNRETQLSSEDKAHWSKVFGIEVRDWKDLIPMSWKSSAAMHFEDAQPEEGGEGN